MQKKPIFLHAPNGSIGMETSFAAAYTALVKTGVLTFTELIEKMSVRPAELLGIEAGAIGAGEVADIALGLTSTKRGLWTPKKLHGKAATRRLRA